MFVKRGFSLDLTTTGFMCQVTLPHSLGYGMYEWDLVGDNSALANADANVVLGSCTFLPETTDE